MVIRVTQEDIVSGKRGNCRLCPVALAVKRAMPSAEDVRVLPGLIWFSSTEQDRWTSAMVAESVGDFIFNFDNFGSSKVKPFEFWLAVKVKQVK